MKTAILIILALVGPVVAIAFWVLTKTAHQGEDNNPSESDTQGTGTTVPSSEESSDSTDGASPHVSQEPHDEYEPKFVIGDKITNGHDTYIIQDVKPNGYLLEGQPPLYMPFTEEEKWELVQDQAQSDTQETGTTVPPVSEAFTEMVARFSKIVPIPKDGITYQWLFDLWTHQDGQFWQKELFPTVVDYFGDDMASDLISAAWLFAHVLAELVPEKRDALYQTAYDYCGRGADMPVYGWSFEYDPNIGRMVAAAVYATTRAADKVAAMRQELGGTMLTYKTDISETFVDTRKFMPHAPGPSLDGKKENLAQDQAIHETIAEFCNLDTSSSKSRQTTIQAISNKEYHKQHIFGKPRTVTDKQYGEMTFNPVFGKHNLGVEIPDNGAIATFVYDFGKACSATRITLLDQEYGRRRPGQGDTDGSANKDPRQRALVNYAIEEGDGHTTGYYDKGGYYVDGNGNYIGDYETFYQSQLYANSYPSGHSAYIEGVGMLLMMVMPEQAEAILKATNEFAISRCICRYHWMSDTIQGRVIGSTMVPVLAATTNNDFDRLLKNARSEYLKIKDGDGSYAPTDEPSPEEPSPVEPTEKVNTSLSWVLGGYGSCHVDAGEKQMGHCCTKEANKERYPSIVVSQTVDFTISGAGVTTFDGKTTGTFEKDMQYVLRCPAVTDGKDRTATITLRNEKGVRVIYYTLSLRGTHDDGPAER